MLAMVDLHSHILPGLDDGAPSLEISVEMARVAVESGVRAMVATLHCDSDRGREVIMPGNCFVLPCTSWISPCSLALVCRFTDPGRL